MQALSDFAEYVEQQQSLRFPASSAAQSKTANAAQHHEELDELFDNLDLADTAPRVQLKTLLLSEDDESLQQLQNVLDERIGEGMGETVFELGYENNGDYMQLTTAEWDKSYKRLVQAAEAARAKCQLLVTRHVGGEVEAPSVATNPGKDKSCTGKVMIRRIPAKIEEAIETRIAVVGNGMAKFPIGHIAQH